MCKWILAQELESFYTEVHATQSRLPIFPQTYTVSALLGCVDVVDCLPVSSQTVHVALMLERSASQPEFVPGPRCSTWVPQQATLRTLLPFRSHACCTMCRPRM